MSKGSVIGATVLCLVALGLGACSEREEAREAKPFPAIRIERSDTEMSREYVADIRALQHVSIRSQLKGVLERAYVDEGQDVEVGTLLFSLRKDEYREELSKAEAVLKSARADVRSLELELKNVQRLVVKAMASETESLLAAAKLESARARMDEAQAGVSSAALNLSWTEIRAPFAGTIGRFEFRPGSFVEEGSSLTNLLNNREVVAYFHLGEREYFDRLREDASYFERPAILQSPDGQIRAQNGRIEMISPEVDPQTGVLTLRTRFLNPDGLIRHGSAAKVVLTSPMPQSILIPQKATFEIQDQIFAFVVGEDRTARMRRITTRGRIGEHFLVESGVGVDETLVVEGVQYLSDGALISTEIAPPSVKAVQTTEKVT